MQFNSDLATLSRQNLELKHTVAYFGEPGIGKSSFVEDLAESMGTTAFVLPCNQLAAKEDLTGARLVPTEDGSSYTQVFYPHHVVQEAIDYAVAHPDETPILFADEINRTTSDVTSGVLTMVTLRKMGHAALPDNLRIIVAGNDKGNVTTLDEASLTRFTIFRVEPSASTLIDLIGDDLNPWVKQVLTKHPELVFSRTTPNAIVADSPDPDDADSSMNLDDFDTGEEMNQITTPRTIEHVSQWLNMVTHEQLTEYLATSTKIDGREASVLEEILTGYVGETLFTVKLQAVIAEELTSGGSTPSTQISVSRPTCYTDLKKKTTITDLAAAVEDLDDNERSGSLLYALKENEDNTRLIDQLAQITTQLEPEHTTTLVKLAAAEQINRANLEAFLDLDTPISNGFKMALSAYL